MDILEERKKIDALGEIRTISFRVIQDTETEISRLRLEDEAGKIYELPLTSTWMQDTESEARMIVVNHALNKAFGKMWYRNELLQVRGTDVLEAVRAINEARKLKGIGKPIWLNEAESRFYDHVPEHWLI